MPGGLAWGQAGAVPARTTGAERDTQRRSVRAVRETALTCDGPVPGAPQGVCTQRRESILCGGFIVCQELPDTFIRHLIFVTIKMDFR